MARSYQNSSSIDFYLLQGTQTYAALAMLFTPLLVFNNRICSVLRLFTGKTISTQVLLLVQSFNFEKKFNSNTSIKSF